MTEHGDQTASSEESLAAALAPFGWTCTTDFWQRYYQDPWVFNLANAVERLSVQNKRLAEQLDEAQLRSIEARNPGIDMAEVRRLRAATDGRTGGAE